MLRPMQATAEQRRPEVPAGLPPSAMQEATDGDARTTSYSYDALIRLTGASGAISRGYAYDVDFNRTSKTEGGTTSSYGYNAANELTTVNGTNTFSYDGNGNLTGGGGWPLPYNAKNQTTSITRPGGSALSPLLYAGTEQTERTQASTVQYITSALGVSSATEPGTGTGTVAVGPDDCKPPAGSTDYYTRDNDGG